MILFTNAIKNYIKCFDNENDCFFKCNMENSNIKTQLKQMNLLNKTLSTQEEPLVIGSFSCHCKCNFWQMNTHTHAYRNTDTPMHGYFQTKTQAYTKRNKKEYSVDNKRQTINW